MCGIVACLSIKKNVIDKIILGLELLQNRGYDSAGICYQSNSDIKMEKYASNDNCDAIQALKQINLGHSCLAIGHTRWATHGPKTKINSHPHFSDGVFLVHNGIIENFHSLKEELSEFEFITETDTEVIAHLISFYIKTYKKEKTIEQILDLVQQKLVGTWAIACIIKEYPDSIFFFKNGSPLLIGLNETELIAASEPIAFYNYINTYCSLPDKSIVRIQKNEDKIDLTPLGNYPILRTVKSKIQITPYPFSHWTIKEIMEQPNAILRATNLGDRIKNGKVVLNGLIQFKKQILELDQLLILGCGTSLYAGLLGSMYFEKLEAFNLVKVIDASEFEDYHIPKKGKTGLLVLSQSGETKDIDFAIEKAKEHNLLIISIVNVVGSLIARKSDCGVYINAGREVAVASTKSFTSQVVVLSLIAVWVAQNKGHQLEKCTDFLSSIKTLPYDFEQVLSNWEECKNVVQIIKNKKNCFILGREECSCIAKEASLKIKEITYLHAEGYPGGALKHGPFALIENGTVVFIIAPDNKHYNKMCSAAAEVKARGATTILITNKTFYNQNLFDFKIDLPWSKTFAALISIIPFQMIAYELSITKNINPDKPRNLAKVVTVDG